MKGSTIFTKMKKLFCDRKFWVYIMEFFVVMLALYLFFLFGAGLSSPGFTYAEF